MVAALLLPRMTPGNGHQLWKCGPRRGLTGPQGHFSLSADVAFTAGSLGTADAAHGNRAAVSCPSRASPLLILGVPSPPGRLQMGLVMKYFKVNAGIYFSGSNLTLAKAVGGRASRDC